MKIFSDNQLIDIETNKKKSARLNFSNIKLSTKQYFFKIDCLSLDEDEFIENCFKLDRF